MKLNKSLKLNLWTLLLASAIGLTACAKKTEETPTTDNSDEPVPMSAEPADTDTPAIVADDLDQVDEQANIEPLPPIDEEAHVHELTEEEQLAMLEQQQAGQTDSRETDVESKTN